MASVTIKPLTRNSTSFDAARIERDLNGALDQVAALVEKDYNATTVTWRHRARATVSKSGVGERTISMSDKVWNMLDEGTRPHAIRPRGAKRLAFSPNFTPKTQPGFIGSGSGGSSGATVFAKSVQHPGTKARKWSETISKKHEQSLADLVDKILEEIDL